MVRGSIDSWALGAAVVLGATALAAPVLGIAAWQPAAMAGAVAAGLVYVVCRVLALEHLLERAAGAHRPPLVFLLLPFGFYLALIPWSIQERAPDGDEPWFLLTTHSIAHDFDLDLANNYRDQHSLAFMPRAIEPQPGDPETSDGTIRSRHGAVLQALMAPAYRLGGRAGAMVVIAALAALGAWLLLDLTAFSPDARARLAAYATFSFAAPFLIYSQQIWAEVAAVLLAVAAFRWIDRLTAGPRRESLEAFRANWITWLMLAGALALLPAIKLRLALVSATLALVCLLRLGPALRKPGSGAAGRRARSSRRSRAVAEPRHLRHRAGHALVGRTGGLPATGLPACARAERTVLRPRLRPDRLRADLAAPVPRRRSPASGATGGSCSRSR